MALGNIYGFGYTPSEFLRDSLGRKAHAGEIDKSEVVLASEWEDINGQITGIRYDFSGGLKGFNFRYGVREVYQPSDYFSDSDPTEPLNKK